MRKLLYWDDVVDAVSALSSKFLTTREWDNIYYIWKENKEDEEKVLTLARELKGVLPPPQGPTQLNLF